MADVIEEIRAERKKASHVGAPAIFLLHTACRQINEAFGEGYGCYLVGSALAKPDWRDVDVRLILGDQEFARLFPDAGNHWEHDPRWLLLTCSISRHLSEITGLPIDFQFQPRSHANTYHKGPRSALGLKFSDHSDRAALSKGEQG